MKKLFSLITSVAIISTFSCKKDDSNPSSSSSTSGCKVHTMTHNPDSTKNKSTITLDFNSNGKVSKVNINEDGKSSYITYEYTTNTIVENNYDTSNTLVNKTTYNVGANGYVQTADGVTYEQDANGYLAKETQSDSSYSNVTVYTISNGNKIKAIRTYTAGGYSSNDTTVYEYYTDKNNSTESHGFALFGKANKNLLKKSTSGSGNTLNVHEYTYTFDSNGNATTEIETYTSSYYNGSTYVTTTQVNKTNYTYTCN